MKTILFVILLCVFSRSVGAEPIRVLFEYKSPPGVSLDQAMLELSPRLREFADRTGFEACGEIAQSSSGQFGTIITTSLSKTVCAIDPLLVPEGMRSIGQSIHTHGKNEEGMLTRHDLRLRGENMDARSALRSRIKGQDIHHFSEADLKAEAGYLSIPSGVLYHDAPRQVRRISKDSL